MNHHIKKTFTQQHDQSDCGIACLLSVIKYHGGYVSLERLRELSGTNNEGTSLLGLYQAANQLGFEAEGVSGDIENLVKQKEPAILHVVKNNVFEHFVVFYGLKNGKIIVGDPAENVSLYTYSDLDKIWQSKHCLILKPTDNFFKRNADKRQKQKWFLKLLKPDFNILTSSLIIGILLSVLNLATAAATQKLIDNIIPAKNIRTLFLVVGFVLFLLIIGASTSYFRSLFLIKQNRNFNNRIIAYFYKSLIDLPKSFFDTRAIGDMIARLNDTSRIQNFISQLVGNFAIDAIMLIASLTFIFYYSPIFSVIIVTFFSLYFVVIYLQTRKVVKYQRQIMEKYAYVETNYINTIGGIDDIKNFNKQNSFNNQNVHIYDEYQRKIYNLGDFQAKLTFLNNLLSSVFLITVFGFGALQVIENQLMLGVFMAIFGVSSAILPYVANLTMIIIPLNGAKIAFERMYEFTGLPKEIEGNQTDFEFTSIEVKNIAFRFIGRRQLFSNVSFEVKKNEIIAIVGENGCGKSTLLQILNKSYYCEKGTITVNEKYPINEINLTLWREKIAIVPQQIHIFNGTVIENIAMRFGDDNYDDVEAFLKETNFLNFFDEFPSGLMTIVGEVGINLSGGQKQLIAIVRALFKQPHLLIIDEATSAMDIDKENFIIQHLNKIKHKTSVIFITHKIHILKIFADRIYVFNNGNTNLFGTHEKLMLSENFYSKFWQQIHG
ncbi:MAG: peptidase domain-containing ABC transporter [Prevotellaceae bacterium]|jgi:ATP-binding cassette subfamily B protein|nr:peptidase domain-containing ABC transporter [Prevotellaceae bacterium]